MMNPISLPEFAFLDLLTARYPEHKGRTVVLHVRTATVLEIFSEDNDEFALHPEVPQYRFVATGERLVIASHYSFDEEYIHDILERAAAWYIDYCNWEDNYFDHDPKDLMN